MFPSLDPSATPVRLAITAVIPIGVSKPTEIVVTCDPPSDRFELVWYQDTMTDVFTPEEALDAVCCMVHQALQVLATGQFQKDHLPDPNEPLFGVPREMEGQLALYQ